MSRVQMMRKADERIVLEQARIQHIVANDILGANSLGHIRIVPQRTFNAYPYTNENCGWVT